MCMIMFVKGTRRRVAGAAARSPRQGRLVAATLAYGYEKNAATQRVYGVLFGGVSGASRYAPLSTVLSVWAD